MNRNTTSAEFRAEVRRHNDALTALHAHQQHICREHPVTFREALAWIGTEHRADAIASAIGIANHQPCDPFEGL